MTICYQDQDGTAMHFHPDPGNKRASQLHKMYQSRFMAKDSWWWAERLPGTCRVVIPIKLEFSASVGFIHKESVTMHSHMIIKKMKTVSYVQPRTWDRVQCVKVLRNTVYSVYKCYGIQCTVCKSATEYSLQCVKVLRNTVYKCVKVLWNTVYSV